MTSPVRKTTRVSLTAFIRSLIEDALRRLHTGHPARVLAVDGGFVRVQPLLLEPVRNADGVAIPTALPPISSVPVLYLAGGGWTFTFPLAVDDLVYLSFSERSLDAFLNADPGALTDPADSRHHDLSDVVAIPALRQRSAPYAALDTAALRIGREDRSTELELHSDGTVTIAGGPVRLGGASAVKGVARLGDAVQTPMPASLIAVESFIPPGAVLVSAPTPAGFAPNLAPIPLAGASIAGPPLPGAIVSASLTVKAVD